MNNGFSLSGPRCADCQHARELPQNAALECRRHPPAMMLLPTGPTVADPQARGAQLVPVCPIVHPEGYCGEFAAKGAANG